VPVVYAVPDAKPRPPADALVPEACDRVVIAGVVGLHLRSTFCRSGCWRPHAHEDSFLRQADHSRLRVRRHLTLARPRIQPGRQTQRPTRSSAWRSV